MQAYCSVSRVGVIGKEDLNKWAIRSQSLVCSKAEKDVTGRDVYRLAPCSLGVLWANTENNEYLKNTLQYTARTYGDR